MAAKTGTYTKIATTTLGSAQSTVSFTSISGSFTDLVLIVNGGLDSGGAECNLRFNSDTGSNYSYTALEGNGTSASSYRGSNQTKLWFTSYYNTSRSMSIINIQDYSNSTTYKTALIRHNNTSVYTAASAGIWRSTSAITAIELYPASYNWATGTTFILYGIEAGNL